MQTTLRAAIMLSVLVGLPAAWVYYGPLPEKGQRAVNRLVAVAKDAIGGDEGAPPRFESAVASSRFRATDVDVAPWSPPPRQGATGAASPGERTLAARVEPLLVRLRQLGVVEYALEPWGGQRQMFRFHCEMPLARGGQATEQFEAIAADPHESIEHVVAEVSSWQAGRLATLAAAGPQN